MRCAVALTMLLCLIGCSARQEVAPSFDDGVVFEVHALRGTIRYISGECQVDSPVNEVAHLTFRPFVRYVELPLTENGTPREEVATVVKSGELRVKALTALPADGVVLYVTLFDGRRFPLRLRTVAENSALTEGARASITVRGMFNVPRSLGVHELLASINAAQHGAPIGAGIEELLSASGTLAFDTPKLRAMYLKSYRHRDLTVHVLEVSNRSDQSQELTEELFLTPTVERVQFERTTLAPRSFNVEVNEDRTKVFVVLREARTL